MCNRCGQPTANNPAICDSCQTKTPPRKESTRLYDANVRDKRADEFYHSAEWKRSRLAYLASIGWLCEDCADEVRRGLRDPTDIQAATDVHHVEPLAKCWERRLDWSNFRGLCDTHHKAKRRKKDPGGA